MKNLLNKVKATNGYKELKVFIQQKVHAEIGRVAKRYNENQQAQQQPETDDGAQGTCNDLPQFKAIALDTPAPQEAHTKLVASPDVLQQVLVSDTVVLTSTSPLPRETEVDTADVPANQLESTLVKIPDAPAATDFGDSFHSNAEPVVTVGTPQGEHS